MALAMLAIADGLAARFAPGVLTPPTNPATALPYTNIRESTARLPNNLTAFPCVEVYPPAPGGSTMIFGGGIRTSEHEFTVRFYYGQSSGDLERDMVALYLWWSVLIDQLAGASKLGIGPPVMKAIPLSSGIGIHEYGGVEYAVIELAVQIKTEDTI